MFKCVNFINKVQNKLVTGINVYVLNVFHFNYFSLNLRYSNSNLMFFFSVFRLCILFPHIFLHIMSIFALNIQMFIVLIMFQNYPLLSLLPGFMQTPLEHSFCVWIHKGWRQQIGEGYL